MSLTDPAKKKIAIATLAATGSQERAAKAAGVSTRTVKRWLKSGAVAAQNASAAPAINATPLDETTDLRALYLRIARKSAARLEAEIDAGTVKPAQLAIVSGIATDKYRVLTPTAKDEPNKPRVFEVVFGGVRAKVPVSPERGDEPPAIETSGEVVPEKTGPTGAP